MRRGYGKIRMILVRATNLWDNYLLTPYPLPLTPYNYHFLLSITNLVLNRKMDIRLKK